MKAVSWKYSGCFAWQALTSFFEVLPSQHMNLNMQLIFVIDCYYLLQIMYLKVSNLNNYSGDSRKKEIVPGFLKRTAKENCDDKDQLNF